MICRGRTESALTSRSSIDPQLLSLAQEYLKSLSLYEQPDEDHKQAWDMFYQSCDQFIRSVCARQGVPQSEIDDVAQQVWTSLLEQLKTFEHNPDRGKVQTWLYAVIRNTVIDGWRRRARRMTCSLESSGGDALVDVTYDPVIACERHENEALVHSGMDQLKGRLSKVNFRLAEMRWFEEKSVAETAEALGLSTHQVWFRQHRIKKKLKEFLVQN